MEEEELYDRVLRMHRCEGKTRCYELAGTRTANVRDQLLRATLLVTRLCERPNPELTPELPLLVIGGGAAGAAAAMVASAAGVPCLLIERKAMLFQCQWGVKTRWLDPTEFDWPHPGWEETAWPPEETRLNGVPRSFLRYEKAGEARALAAKWQKAFDRWCDRADEQAGGRLGRIHVMTEREYNPNPARSTIEINFSTDYVTAASRKGYPPLPLQRFGAVVSCVGLGEEKVAIDRYDGPKFWSTDTLGERLLGQPAWPSDSRMVHALISGGGDGAQQDVLRVLCGDFGRRLLPKLGYERRDIDFKRLMAADHQRHAELREAKKDVQAAEAAIEQWDRVFVGAAKIFWEGLSAQRAEQVTKALLREEVFDGELHLTWMLRGSRPTYSYGLNRFLTALALLVYAAKSGRPLYGDSPNFDSKDIKDHPIVLRGHQLAAMASALRTHSCGKLGHACHKSPHWATVNPAGSQGTKGPSNPFNFVIVRHGLKEAALFGGAPEREQLMPPWIADH